MKVFFNASQRGKKYFEENYKKIYSLIENLGFKHLDDEIITTSETKFYQDLLLGGKKAEEIAFNKKIRAVQEADVCIFEVSISSTSIGFQIRKSLELNKPTALLYFKENYPHFLLGDKEEKLITKNYTDNNLKEIVNDIFIEIVKLRDKRFNFYVNTDLLNYLEEVSKKMSITKSTFIRNLIIKHKDMYEKGE